MSPETETALQKHFEQLEQRVKNGRGLDKVTACAASVEFGELLLILIEDYPEIGEATRKQMTDFTTASLLELMLNGPSVSIKRI